MINIDFCGTIYVWVNFFLRSFEMGASSIVNLLMKCLYFRTIDDALTGKTSCINKVFSKTRQSYDLISECCIFSQSNDLYIWINLKQHHPLHWYRVPFNVSSLYCVMILVLSALVYVNVFIRTAVDLHFNKIIEPREAGSQIFKVTWLSL